MFAIIEVSWMNIIFDLNIEVSYKGNVQKPRDSTEQWTRIEVEIKVKKRITWFLFIHKGKSWGKQKESHPLPEKIFYLFCVIWKVKRKLLEMVP